MKSHAHKDGHGHEPHYQNIKVKDLPESEVEITGEITAKAFAEYQKAALEYFKAHIELPGFRKGTAPEAMVLKKVDEQALLNEAAEMALGHDYGHIVEDHKIEVIGRPQIAITSMPTSSKDASPLAFSIKVATFPKFTLPDYKSITKKESKKADELAEKNDTLTVHEKEVDEAVENIRKAWVEQQGSGVDKGASESAIATGTVDTTVAPLELNDEFAAKVSKYKTFAEMKEKIREHLGQEKKSRTNEKKRVAIGKELVDATPIEIPRTLLDGELNRMLAQFKNDIEGMPDTTFESYLEGVKKTEADLRKEWEPDAKKRVTLQLIVNKIAQEEKLLPTDEEINREADAIMSHYTQADPTHIRAYVETVLGNEKVFNFLEGLK